VSRRAISRPVLLLVVWHAALAAGAWLAPHPGNRQYREYPFAPPTRIRLLDANRGLAWPHVCALEPEPARFGAYREDCARRFPVRFLASRPGGGIALMQAVAPGSLFLLGTDELGRDVFSRLLLGGVLSLGCGLSAACLALALAAWLGSLAGLLGGLADAVISRGAEVLMALPILYLLLAMRAALPIQSPPLTGFLMAVCLIALAGWARPARLVRGIVLSARERGYVLAARGFGAGSFYLLRKHLLPELRGVLHAQAAVLIPRFVILEVTLSLLGLGVPEPASSWGSMLASLRQYDVLATHPWMLAPAAALTLSLALFGHVGRWLEVEVQEKA
jgi:peptide/nickel transport system permease protein